MLHLILSEDVESLVYHLVGKLALFGDPFVSPTIVVPNGNTRAYLEFAIARANGVAANLHVTYLPAFIKEIARNTGRKDIGPLERTFALNHVLRSEPATADLPPRNREQLAAKLAHLFGRYELEAPAMCEQWLAAETLGTQTTSDLPKVHEHDALKHASWRRGLIDQAHLFRRLFGANGILYSNDVSTPWQTPNQVFDIDPEHLHLPDEVFIFGLSYLATDVLNTLRGLAKQATVHLFALNPTTELTHAESKWVAPLIAHTETLAAGAQVLTLQNTPRQPPQTAVLACPSIQRELEAIACSIWELVAQSAEGDVPIQLHEVAVVVPPSAKDAYLTRVQSAFLTVNNLPFNMIDQRPDVSSRYVDGLLRLLELPLGNFTRRDFLTLLTHPCVAGRWDGDVNTEKWEQWVDVLGIFGGMNQEDTSAHYLDAYAERIPAQGVHHWAQGLSRLAAGCARDEGSDAPLSTPEGDREDVARLTTLARSLMQDARALKTMRATLPEWGDVLEELARHYLRPDGDNDTAMSGALGVLRELGRTQLSELAFGFREVVTWVCSRLESVPIERGQYLSSGVVVSSFLPLRPIPFRAVFVAGMNNGVFPRVHREHPLDMRTAWRRTVKETAEIPSEVTSRQADEVLFWETTRLAKEHLVFSYISKDAQTGAPLELSPLVREYIDSVASEGTTIDGSKVVGSKVVGATIEVPLRRFDARGFKAAGLARHNHIKAARTERRLSMARDRLAEVWPEDAKWPPTRTELESLLGDSPSESDTLTPVERLRQRTRVWCDEGGPQREAKEETTLRALRTFITKPSQATAQAKLGLYASEKTDVYTVEHERFGLGRFDLLPLARDVHLRLGNGGRDEGQTIAEALLWSTSPAFIGPLGDFVAIEAKKTIALVGQWRRQMGRADLWFEDLRTSVFGHVRYPISEEPHARYTALAIGEHRLTGETPLMDPSGEHMVVFEATDYPTRKAVILPFLAHLALCVHQAPIERRLHIIARKKATSYVLEADPEAEERLGSLVGALQSGGVQGVLPFTLVADQYKEILREEGGSDEALAEVPSVVRDKVRAQIRAFEEDPERSRLDARYGPIRRIADLGAARPEEVEHAWTNWLLPILQTPRAEKS